MSLCLLWLLWLLLLLRKDLIRIINIVRVRNIRLAVNIRIPRGRYVIVEIISRSSVIAVYFGSLNTNRQCLTLLGGDSKSLEKPSFL